MPMCSPHKVGGKPPPRRPAELIRYPLLHDDSLGKDATATDWASWLKAAGVDDPNPNRGSHFNHSDHALQAAINGLGVVLGRRALAESDIAEGRLMAPFELTLPLTFAYHMVCPELMADRPKVAAFREWLLSEVRQPGGGAVPRKAKRKARSTPRR